MRDFLAGYFSEEALKDYANIQAKKVHDLEAEDILTFVAGHSVRVLSLIEYIPRYRLIRRLADCFDDAIVPVQQRIQIAVFKLLFTSPYPKDYEAFEDKWVLKTAEYLKDERIAREITPQEYLPMTKRAIEAQMQAYRDVTGITDADAVSDIFIDLHSPNAAWYTMHNRRITINPFKQGHLALRVIGGALHEQVHDVSLRDCLAVHNAVLAKSPLPKTPYTKMAHMLGMDYALYDKVGKVSGDLGKYVLLTERLAVSFQYKVEYALNHSKHLDYSFHELALACAHEPKMRQAFRKMHYDLKIPPNSEDYWVLFKHRLSKTNPFRLAR